MQSAVYFLCWPMVNRFIWSSIKDSKRENLLTEFWFKKYYFYHLNCTTINHQKRINSGITKPVLTVVLENICQVSSELRKHFGTPDLGRLTSCGVGTTLLYSMSVYAHSRGGSWWPGILLALADMLYACTHSYVFVSDILISKNNFVMQFNEVAEILTSSFFHLIK